MTLNPLSSSCGSIWTSELDKYPKNNLLKLKDNLPDLTSCPNDQSEQIHMYVLPKTFHYDHTSLFCCPAMPFPSFLMGTHRLSEYISKRNFFIYSCWNCKWKSVALYINILKRARIIMEDDFWSGDHDKTPIHIMKNLFFPL